MPRMLVVACAVAAILAVPAAAAADEGVSVRLNGLASDMTAGGAPDSLTATVRNRSKNEFPAVGRAFVVRLNGLNAEGVSMWHDGAPLAKQGTAPGEVRLVDTATVSLAPEGLPTSVAIGIYQIQFAASAPGGRAQVIFEAFVSDHRLASASDTVSVKSTGSPAATTTPTATPLSTAPVIIGPTATLDPLPPDPLTTGSTSGIPAIFYGLGAILVSVGGVILWLLFREPRPALVDAAPHQSMHPYPPRFPPPNPNEVVYPTAILPAMRDPRTGSPPSDPWGTAVDDRR